MSLAFLSPSKDGGFSILITYRSLLPPALWTSQIRLIASAAAGRVLAAIRTAITLVVFRILTIVHSPASLQATVRISDRCHRSRHDGNRFDLAFVTFGV